MNISGPCRPTRALCLGFGASQKIYQHRHQIAQANLCVINIETGAAENGVTLWSIFPRNGTQQLHRENPAMAPQHGTQAMAPRKPSNGTPAWHPAMAPNVNPQPLLLEVRAPIAKAIRGIIMSAMAASNGAQREPRPSC